MGASLDSLPSEILNNIIAQFDNSMHSGWLALSNLRRVNRNFCTLLTPVVFESVPLWFSLTAFENVTRIAAQKDLSKCVKQLAISSLHLSPPDRVPDQISRQCQASSFNANLNDLAHTKFVTACATYSAAHACLEEKSEIMLTRIMTQLPNLNDIFVVLGGRWIGAQELHRAFGRLGNDMMQVGCETLMKPIVRAISAAGTVLEKFGIGPSYPYDYAGDEAMSHPYPPIPPFDEDYVAMNAFSEAGWRQSFPNEDYLANLTSLQLVNIDCEADIMENGMFPSWLSAMRTIWKQTPALQDLHIGWDSNMGQSFTALIDKLPNVPLTGLGIYGFRVYGCDTLKRLFEPYQKTLKSMKLIYAEFESDAGCTEKAWRHPLRDLKEQCRFDSLEVFEIWGSNRHRAIDVAAFIAGKISENPFDEVEAREADAGDNDS